MPAGLVKTPDELRDLLAYLLGESPAGAVNWVARPESLRRAWQAASSLNPASHQLHAGGIRIKKQVGMGFPGNRIDQKR